MGYVGLEPGCQKVLHDQLGWRTPGPSCKLVRQRIPSWRVADDALGARQPDRIRAHILEDAEAAGRRNQGRLVTDVARGDRVSAARVVEAECLTEEREELVRHSEFVDWPSRGRTGIGPIVPQDHGDAVANWNLEIRMLP